MSIYITPFSLKTIYVFISTKKICAQVELLSQAPTHTSPAVRSLGQPIASDLGLGPLELGGATGTPRVRNAKGAPGGGQATWLDWLVGVNNSGSW